MQVSDLLAGYLQQLTVIMDKILIMKPQACSISLSEALIKVVFLHKPRV